MSVKSGQTLSGILTTRHPATNAPTDADALPTCTLYVGNTANAATVTVSDITGTGRYGWSVTLPTLNAGDPVSILAAATVAGVPGEDVIFEAVADTKRVSDLRDEAMRGTDNALTDKTGFTLAADERAAIKTALEAEGSHLADIKTAATVTIPAAVAEAKASADLANRVTPVTPEQLTAAKDEIVSAMPDVPPPDSGVLVTPETLGVDGEALGVVMPHGKISAFMDSATTAAYQFDADETGDYTLTLDEGHLWTLVGTPTVGRYKTTVTQVSTVVA